MKYCRTNQYKAARGSKGTKKNGVAMDITITTESKEKKVPIRAPKDLGKNVST